MGTLVPKSIGPIRTINVLGAIPPVSSEGEAIDLAIHLDGSADRVDFGDLNFLDGKTQVSFEAWIYIDSNNFGMIFTDWYLSGATSKKSWQFYWQPDRKLVAVFTLGGTTSHYDGWTSTVIPLQTWTHVAFEVDFSTGVGKWYVNGTGVTTVKGGAGTGPSQVWAGNDQGVVLGARYENGFQLYADGIIANVAMWDDVHWGGDFTPPETYYEGTESNLVCYIPLNEGSGGTVYDIVGSNAGVCQSFVEAWWVGGPFA